MNDKITVSVFPDRENPAPVPPVENPAPQPEKKPEPPKKKRGCFFWSCLTVVVFFLFLLLAVVGGILWLCIPGGDGTEEESLKSDSHGKKGKIAVISVEDIMAYGNNFSNANPENFEKLLRKAEKDSSVRGVILSLNTPGGEVTAADDMYRMVRAFRKKTGKPVVALMNSVAASGGFYLAMGCDKVLASPMTMTGSIGVIISTYNFSSLAGWLGVENEVYKSGPMKDMLNPMQSRTKEEKAIVEALVRETYLRFVDVVAESRKLPPETLRDSPVADGRILSAKQALEAKLIDGFGRQEDACHLVEQLVKAEKNSLEPVRYRKRVPFMEMLMESGARTGKLSVELPGFSSRTKLRGGVLYFLAPDMMP